LSEYGERFEVGAGCLRKPASQSTTRGVKVIQEWENTPARKQEDAGQLRATSSQMPPDEAAPEQ